MLIKIQQQAGGIGVHRTSTKKSFKDSNRLLKLITRHLLATRQQKAGETLYVFLRELRKLDKDCNFKPVSAEQYREELIRDAFINGLASPVIRQRLLENKTLDLQAAYDQAYSLDLPKRNASFYSHMLPHVGHTAAVVTSDPALITDDHVKSGPTSESCEVTAGTQSLYRAATLTTIKGRKLTALVDSCSDDSYVDEDVARELKLPIHPTDKDVALAQKSLHTHSPELDAYPLPRIDTMVNELSTYCVFSTYDLKSAYHQVPLKESDKKYTAFEANKRLYQFCRVPFGVTNGVAAFQRTMDKLVKEENLQGA
ncbi:uncharacterized protein [Palaemon carinicauda]|uniref:uncharacterized protein n=1 Tax=Palaemon carinicauda TaxID=392227 RepID=UPI0035B5F747